MKRILIASAIAVAMIGISYPFSSYYKNSFAKTSAVKVILPPKVSVIPAEVIQGEPVMISVDNLVASTTVTDILFANKSVKFFLYNSKPTALVPVDLNRKVGDYSIVVKLSNGSVLKNSLTVSVRPKVEASLGIPAKLGGNTATSQKNLVNNLADENALIKALPTGLKAFWSQNFQYPISNPAVTDPFGYSRLTGAYTITHLGADFRADEGTPVAAMNRGVIRFAHSTTIYGKMIVIDHGLGLETLYAHLSKIKVSDGQLVEKGEIIGESGKTGYAEQPHLHVSVKINNISVDPIKFLNLFK